MVNEAEVRGVYKDKFAELTGREFISKIILFLKCLTETGIERIRKSMNCRPLIRFSRYPFQYNLFAVKNRDKFVGEKFKDMRHVIFFIAGWFY